MAIQNRRGQDLWFDPNKMLPGEMAVSTDAKRVYVAFAPGDVREFAFKDQIPIVGDVTPDKLQEAVNNYLNENPIHAGATEEEAKQIELNKRNIETLNGEVNQLSNPNLLINGDFRNPINQRGQTIYTDKGTPTYTIDMWRLEGGNGRTVTVNNGYVSLYNNDSEYEGFFTQSLEFTLPEDDYTITINVKHIDSTARVILGGHSFNLAEGINTFSIHAAITDVTIAFGLSGIIELYWVKLERGTISTLITPETRDAAACINIKCFEMTLSNPSFTKSASGLYYSMIEIPSEIEFVYLLSTVIMHWSGANGLFDVTPYGNEKLQIRANAAISITSLKLRTYYI